VDGTIFDSVAELYDRVRPAYPEAVFDDLAELAGLPPGAHVVEVGPGTGQATQALARRDWAVTAIEPGPALAAVAGDRLGADPRVTVVVSRFEDWTPPDGATFDAVFAATAWHWVDPGRAYRKAASILRPDGVLAVVTTHHVSPMGGDPFFAEIQDVYCEIGESDVRGGPPDPDDVEDDLAAEIVASGRFDEPAIRRHVWSREYTAHGYIDLLRTYSGHIAMAEPQRRQLFDAIRVRVGARERPVVEKHYLNVVYVARRR
jgi:SAM-dependent methyltransferase